MAPSRIPPSVGIWRWSDTWHYSFPLNVPSISTYSQLCTIRHSLGAWQHRRVARQSRTTNFIHSVVQNLASTRRQKHDVIDACTGRRNVLIFSPFFTGLVHRRAQFNSVSPYGKAIVLIKRTIANYRASLQKRLPIHAVTDDNTVPTVVLPHSLRVILVDFGRIQRWTMTGSRLIQARTAGV